MKTFKLCTLRILMDESGRDTTIPVAIQDGLTVSTEQTAQWVAEIVVPSSDQPIVDELFT
ncbi:MAG: YwpF family protein, partial [Exiguobacterium sp.]